MNQLTSMRQTSGNFNPTIIASTLPQHSLTRMQARHSQTKENACQNCHLSSLCLAKGLDQVGLDDLHKIVKKPAPLPVGQHLYKQTDKFNSLFFIRSGAVKSYSYSTDGEEVGVGFYLPGEVIGLDGIFTKKYMSSIITLEDTFVCEFPFDLLEKLFSAYPILQKHFIELQSRQLIQSHEMTIMHGQKSADDRLISFLINLSERYRRLDLSPFSFRLPMARKDIAASLSLAHETISRLLKSFQQNDWLKVNGRDVTLTNLPGIESS